MEFSQNRSDNLKEILVGVVIVAVLTTLFVYRQQISRLFTRPQVQTATTTPVTIEQMRAMPPLPKADEAMLQKQLQDIVAKGKESDCASLSDSRYQFACHSIITAQKK